MAADPAQVELSDDVRAICRRFWRAGKDKRPLPDCCSGCPIHTECSAPTGPGWAGLYAHRHAFNAAASEAIRRLPVV